MATPHIAAKPNDFAPVVLMPGDPKRAERMAEAILADAKLVTDTRGMLGFTGVYSGDGPNNGQPLSIMGSGMGMPSMGLYATELFRFYGVERIIRVGTAGGIQPWIEVGSVVIANGAHTSSGMNESRIIDVHFSAVADLPLAAAAWAARDQVDMPVYSGTIVTADHFYFYIPTQSAAFLKHNTLAVDMETAALYGVAAEFGKQALSILTISDNRSKKGREMTAEAREKTFQDALKLALAAAFA